jgi:DNA modification methylase
LKPYYEDEFATLFHGDCREVLPSLPGDVLVMDPPFGIAYDSGWDSTMARSIEGDDSTVARDAVLSCWGDFPAIVFGSWKAPRPEATRMVLIWDTLGALGMGDLSLPWKPAHQEIYVLGSGFNGPRTTDVLSIPPVQSMAKNGRVHPHQKPLALMLELIRKCPDGTITDPFAGSGSTLVAAKKLGRRSFGWEIDERYCAIAASRLRQKVFNFTGKE